MACFSCSLVIKYRRKVIDDANSTRLREIFEYIQPNYNITLQEWNHDRDHVHILFTAHPNSELQGVHDHVPNQRKDHPHKISRSLVDRYDLICMEDLQVKGMMKNHRLAKSIANASWGRLGIYLDYQARNMGKQLIKVPPHHTSQRCSSGCGTIVKKDLSVRIHKCPVCGLEIDRDVNAAINILHRGIGILQQSG